MHTACSSLSHMPTATVYAAEDDLGPAYARSFLAVHMCYQRRIHEPQMPREMAEHRSFVTWPAAPPWIVATFVCSLKAWHADKTGDSLN
ncbi:hypothetical protein A0H81_14719 [Grifola frondosa]|uniref:Uncharacterized protein n=1 Tax=Grifola frondosa TaxID=5627 RepID=A0A1C7LMR4_GRIFR|nr:hypothetical protein A0H81_14719 [Grifola frondosa]